MVRYIIEQGMIELFSPCRYSNLPAEWEPPKKQEFKEIVSNVCVYNVLLILVPFATCKARVQGA